MDKISVSTEVRYIARFGPKISIIDDNRHIGGKNCQNCHEGHSDASKHQNLLDIENEIFTPFFNGVEDLEIKLA